MALNLSQVRAIIAAPRTREVELPELGDDATVHVRVLKLGEVEDLQKLSAAQDGPSLLVSRQVVVWAACNPDGTPMFPAGDEGMRLTLDLPWKVVDRLSKAVLEFSEMVEKGSEGETTGPKFDAPPSAVPSGSAAA